MHSDPPLPNPDAASQPDPKTPIPEAASPFEYRGNGRIARLPKHLRDQVNTLMRDGVSYPDIIQRLGEHGKDLKPDNLSQ